MSEQDETRGAEPAPAPIADPAPLGLAVFGVSLWVLAGSLAGWYDQASAFIPLALFVGGLGDVLVGMWEFRNQNTFGAMVFSGYGTFWISTGLLFLIPERLGLSAAQDLNTALGFILMAWAIFTLYVWIATFRLNVALIVTITLLLALFIVLTLGFLFGSTALITIGGYIGLIDALAAFYVSAAGVIASTFGRSVLPVG